MHQSVSRSRDSCRRSKHLFRSYIFYKGYLSYIVHLRGLIGRSLFNFEQISTVFLQSSPRYTRWFISMRVCFVLDYGLDSLLFYFGYLCCMSKRTYFSLINNMELLSCVRYHKDKVIVINHKYISAIFYSDVNEWQRHLIFCYPIRILCFFFVENRLFSILNGHWLSKAETSGWLEYFHHRSSLR